MFKKNQDLFQNARIPPRLLAQALHPSIQEIKAGESGVEVKADFRPAVWGCEAAPQNT